MGDAIASEAQEEERKKESEGQRLYSAHHLLALEQALQSGMNVTLASFRCAESYAVVRSDVKRYWTAKDKLDPELCEDGVVRRACVQRLPAGSTSLTVPRDGQKESRGLPSLTVVMDMGPKQFPGMQWIFETWRLRGSLINDPWHADWNGIKSALTETRLYLLVLERALLHQMPSGPWEGASHFHSLRLAATELFTTQTAENALFRQLADRLAEAFGDEPSDYGSTAHLERLWARCQQSDVWRKKCARVRMGR
eukprot:6482768-Amphidinium_carterae.1